MPIAEANDLLRTIALRLRSILCHKMETALPPRLEGLTAVNQRPTLREKADQMYDSTAGIVDAWAFDAPPKLPDLTGHGLVKRKRRKP